MDSDDGGQNAGLGSDDADLGSNDAEGAELPPVGADEKYMTGTKRRVVGAPDPSRCGVHGAAPGPGASAAAALTAMCARASRVLHRRWRAGLILRSFPT